MAIKQASTTSTKVRNKIANRINVLKDKTLEIMRSRGVYDQNQLFDLIYYNPERIHHDYREVREAISLAKFQGI